MQLELVPPDTHRRNAAQGCYNKFQGALLQYNGRYRTRFSAIIVRQDPTTGQDKNQPIAAVQCNSQRFGIRPSKRNIKL